MIVKAHDAILNARDYASVRYRFIDHSWRAIPSLNQHSFDRISKISILSDRILSS